MVRRDTGLPRAVGRLIAALAFGGCIAAAAIVVGTREVESYEHAVFSLDRGTAAEMVSFLGQPVYTLAVGFGVRLPLHGNLGASPAALLAPVLPIALTYWLLLALAIATAVLVVQHALEPVCGRLMPWIAVVLLFASVPMVNYTIYDDWPETAVTYCAYVACVFAPHAMLESVRAASTPTRQRIAIVLMAATAGAFLVLAHPGHWPLLALTLVLTALLALSRTDHPVRTRVVTLAALAAVSIVAVALPTFDIVRDLIATSAGGDTDRAVETVAAGVLESNLFPLGEIHARVPFSYLILAVLAMTIGLASSGATRVMAAGSAAASIALVFGTAALAPRGAISAIAPSAMWALRDPATAFAVLGGAWAVAALRQPGPPRSSVLIRAAAVALALAAIQGPAYAAQLVRPELFNEEAWTRNLTPAAGRAASRGLAPDRVPPGARLALWPDVRQALRGRRQPSIDFADGGYLLVNAWTKQRTMRGVLLPNAVLFNQTTDLPADLLCDAQAVRFLQLRYLLRPADVEPCAPWSPVPDVRVDDWLGVDAARDAGREIHALPVARLGEAIAHAPALADGLELLRALAPLAGTALTIGPTSVALRFEDPAAAIGQVLVLPVAYDPAWRTPSGQAREVGGLLALAGVYQRELTLTFVPDAVARLRALAMTLAQIAALAGILGLASLRRSV